jgi:DNA modification methylase
MVELNDFAAVKTTNATVFSGSNLDVLPFMADNSVDAIVTDPPYELGFMGKSWDSSGIAYSVELWRECLRVLKPGGHLLAFSGSRTYHRMVVAIEDAGFEVRDMVSWISNKTFPKSHNISKAIDKQAGADVKVGKAFKVAGEYGNRDLRDPETQGDDRDEMRHNAQTDEAKKWDGWGTALKPTVEPIVLARKPVVGSVAENVLAWGVGGLNIDASRIGTEERINQPAGNKVKDVGVYKFSVSESDAFNGAEATSVQGRWPANVVFDEACAELLDWQEEDASRFFYVAKASKADRNQGVEANTHPTVKPTNLMRYLIKLVTPAGGVVLDPFTGSGSTGKAALLDGYQFLGIELTDDYLPIIQGRLEWAEAEAQRVAQAAAEKETERLF